MLTAKSCVRSPLLIRLSSIRSGLIRLGVIRLLWALLFAATLVSAASLVQAQDNETPLGDVARRFRKKPVADQAVIDNDNLSKVMEEARAQRASGAAPMLALDPGGKSLQMSSPDVVCSLSFSAKSTSLLADPIMLDEVPRSELAKLDGPATLDGDSLQVSIHNVTAWDLREVTIGLTIVRRRDPDEKTSYQGQARIVPAVAGSAQPQMQEQKRADVTILLHVKGAAAPSTTATFRTPLNFILFPDQEWHWAIVRAKGIPPPPAPVATEPVAAPPVVLKVN
jgi:hypothetical protein